MPYTVRKSEVVYRGRVFDVLKDAVQYPDGRTATFDVLRHGDAVAMVPVTPDGEIIFVRQYRHAIAQDLLEIPAGRLEPGEDPSACAARELKEEIGMAPGKLERIGEFFLAPGYSDEKMIVFLATELSPESLPQDDDEAIEVVPLSLSDSYAALQNGRVQDAKSLLVLLLARPHFPKTD